MDAISSAKKLLIMRGRLAAVVSAALAMILIAVFCLKVTGLLPV